MQRLGQENQREHDREERLQVCEERRPRRADPVDRREPEDVGEEERPDHRVAEAEPDLPAEGGEVLVADLRDADERERHPADCEHERADPVRRVPAHQRRDRDVVGRPGQRGCDREECAVEARADAAVRCGDEADAREGDRGADPERTRQVLEPEGERDQPDEDRRRPEQQRHGRGVRELDPVHEAQLVEEDQQRRKAHEPQVVPRDPERALPPVGEGPEERDRDEVADRPVRKRLPAVLEHVLRDGDVQRPEQDRAEQHRVHGRGSAHVPDATVG